MSKLTQEKIDVLDKLYNIKGEKSIVTTAIKDKIEQKEIEIKNTTLEKDNVIEKQRELEKELQKFIEQSDKFFATFNSFDNSSFSSFQAIGIELLIGDTLTNLRQKAPLYEDSLEERIKNLKKQAEELSRKISTIEDKKLEFIDALNSAEEAREKINDLIEDILRNNNDSYPRKYVKSVLESLCFFSPEEISTLEYLILFREEGLTEYDNGYETRGNKFEEKLKSEEDELLTNNIFTNETKALTSENDIKSISDDTSKIYEEPVIEQEKEGEPVIQVEEINSGIFVKEIPVEFPSEESTIDYSKTEDDAESQNIEENEIIPIEITSSDSINNQFQESQTKLSQEENLEMTQKIMASGIDINNIDESKRKEILGLIESSNENTLSMNNELLRSIGVNQETIYNVYNQD